jgi:hypothetical protein
LEYQRELEIVYAVEEELFATLLETVEYKKLPKAEINRLYQEYLGEYRLSYASSKDDLMSAYDSFDGFMVNNLVMSGILEEGDTDWESAFKKMVEDEVKEKIALFAIIQSEGWILSDDAYADLYRKFLVDGFATDSAGGKREDYDTDEKYEEALSLYEARMKNYYGGDVGLKETIYYNYGIGKIRECVKVVNSYDK